VYRAVAPSVIRAQADKFSEFNEGDEIVSTTTEQAGDTLHVLFKYPSPAGWALETAASIGQKIIIPGFVVN